MPCYKPLKGYKDCRTGGIVFRRSFFATELMEVACGQCLGCRLDHSRMWACRIIHEASLYEHNCFITLTYRDKSQCSPEQLAKGFFLPEDGSLVKSHFQKFMKRLRKGVSPLRVRYFHVGEYGEELSRPHYHACLFNMDFFDKVLFRERDGVRLYTSEILSRFWPYGFSTVGSLDFASAAYCARYCLKKITGEMADDHYLRADDDGVAYWLLAEYVTMSRRPGIGRDFYEKYRNDFFPSDDCPVPGRGVLKKVPRYYLDILEKEDEEVFNEIKERRLFFREEHAEEYSPERLESKYKVQQRKHEMLKRDFEED